MDSFRWMSVAMSMMLGLGVARLLSGGVIVFISRTRARLDWLPMAWAGCIFIAQLQYWWAVIEFASFNETWTIGTFLLLLGLPLMLFAAAALVLPQTELPEGADLREWFNRDGRWALLFLSTYYVLAVLANWILWKHSALVLERTRMPHGRLATRVQFHFLAAGPGDHHRPHTLGMLATLPEVLLTHGSSYCITRLSASLLEIGIS